MCSLQKSKLLIPGVPEWSVWPSKFTCSTYEQCKSKKMSVSPRLTSNSAQMIAIFITPNTLSTPSLWGHCQTVNIPSNWSLYPKCCFYSKGCGYGSDYQTTDTLFKKILLLTIVVIPATQEGELVGTASQDPEIITKYNFIPVNKSDKPIRNLRVFDSCHRKC